MQPSTRIFQLCIGITALGLSSAVFAADPLSSRYGETGNANQPRFDKQWWEVDERGNPPTPTNNPTNAGTTTGSRDCRSTLAAVKNLRERIGDEVARYTRCLERADSQDDCGREFNSLKRIQMDQEDAVQLAGRNCH